MALELAIGDWLAEGLERDAIRKLRDALLEQVGQRRQLIGIDVGGYAGRIVREPRAFAVGTAGHFVVSPAGAPLAAQAPLSRGRIYGGALRLSTPPASPCRIIPAS